MSAFWWAAGEEIEFPIKGGGVFSQTVATGRRTAWTRAQLGPLNDGGAAAGAVMADGMPITPQTSLWLSCQFYPNGNPFADRPEIGLARSSMAVGGIFIGRDSASSSRLALFKVTSAGVVTKLATQVGDSWATGTLHRVDMQVAGFNTASANVKVYLEFNVTATIDWTGALTGLGFTDLDCVRALNNAVGAASYLSEVILADEDTRGFAGVFAMYPDAAGDTNTFTSGTYTDIDEAVLSDADRLESATVSQEFDCNLADITAPGATGVRGIKLTARAVKAATGPGTLQLGIKSGGTVDTVNKTLTTSLQSYERLMPVNPITGIAFTLAEANALQLVLKSAT